MIPSRKAKVFSYPISSLLPRFLVCSMHGTGWKTNRHLNMFITIILLLYSHLYKYLQPRFSTPLDRCCRNYMHSNTPHRVYRASYAILLFASASVCLLLYHSARLPKSMSSSRLHVIPRWLVGLLLFPDYIDCPRIHVVSRDLRVLLWDKAIAPFSVSSWGMCWCFCLG
jgi:hypothetical protein